MEKGLIEPKDNNELKNRIRENFADFLSRASNDPNRLAFLDKPPHNTDSIKIHNLTVALLRLVATKPISSELNNPSASSNQEVLLRYWEEINSRLGEDWYTSSTELSRAQELINQIDSRIAVRVDGTYLADNL